MNLLGAILTNFAVIAVLMDNGYMANSVTFWAVLLLTTIYVAQKI